MFRIELSIRIAQLNIWNIKIQPINYLKLIFTNLAKNQKAILFFDKLCKQFYTHFRGIVKTEVNTSNLLEFKKFFLLQKTTYTL